MGSRATKPQNDTGAVTMTFSPSVDKAADQGFTLIDFAMKSDGAYSTSENITISSTQNGIVFDEDEYDPSTQTSLTVVRQFDKPFPAGTTITVTYVNTDANTLDSRISFELDDNV